MQTAEPTVTPDHWIRERPWIDQPYADIDRYVDGLPEQPGYDLKGKLREWRDNGVVIFENAIPLSLIDAYLADIEVLKRDFKSYEIPIEIKGEQMTSRALDAFPEDLTGVKLNYMHGFSLPAARLSLAPHVADFLRHVFGAPASVCQSLTFWRGSEQPIHIDYPYVRQQHPLSFLAASWIPLEDVHPDAGPLAYYPGGHKTDKSGFFDWGGGSIVYDDQSTRSPLDFAHYLQAQMASKGIQPKIFCPKRGDVLLWHGNLPHEGTAVNNRSLTRKSYVTHYTVDWALPGWMRNFDAHQQRVGVFENGGECFRPPWIPGKSALPSWAAYSAGASDPAGSGWRGLIGRLKGKAGSSGGRA
ncbi:phytanoyl-CoA dioxygenase family protein [Hyphomonas sp.]|uniref:phytanoyl-CoA dioxygenase family protein n=1 Tax=Hyphomonas sp. TaxID=87 RepID=UPI00391DDCA9